MRHQVWNQSLDSADSVDLPDQVSLAAVQDPLLRAPGVRMTVTYLNSLKQVLDARQRPDSRPQDISQGQDMHAPLPLGSPMGLPMVPPFGHNGSLRPGSLRHMST